MKVSQDRRAIVTLLHLLLTALTLTSFCQSSPLSEQQTTNPATSPALSKRRLGMICTGLLPPGRHNYPGDMYAGCWPSLQQYCERTVAGANCACYAPPSPAAPYVRCLRGPRNAAFFTAGATDVCRTACACHDFPEPVPPERKRRADDVLWPAAVGGLGRCGGVPG